VAYDGTPFCGWQTQKNGTSVQALIEDALSTLLREKIVVTGCGRTDAGVHALGQVAHFDTSHHIDPRRVLRSTNSLLPEEIRILDIVETDPTFHARYSAIGKIYHYTLDIGPTPNPFSRNYALFIRYPLNIRILHEAAEMLIGTHDFSAFTNSSPQAPDKIKRESSNNIRTLKRLDICQLSDPYHLQFAFEGDGFLYKMVRNITGTLLEIGRGKRELATLPHILASRDRRRAGPAAPPHGLSLIKALYEDR
jgi:tRNA pseudouridine38-40 synthase